VCSPAHGLLATVLIHLDRPKEAKEVIARALASPPGGGDAYDALAFVALQLGDHETANELYRRAVERAPNDARFRYNLASSERSFGRLAEAQLQCEKAISLDPGHYQSYLLRSELRIQTPAHNHVAAMERLLASRPGDDRACMFLGYALGKELDDLEQYPRAFAWFSRAAAARRRHLAYDVAADVRKLNRIQEVYAAGWSEAPAAARGEAQTESRGERHAAAHDETCTAARGETHAPGKSGSHAVPQSPEHALLESSRRYIFILGLPRSGTTLVERILMRLPGVRSNGETENFSKALLAAAPAQGPDLFARCAAADPALVAQRYRELAGTADSQWVIEKMPLNYLYVGAIRQALPGATPILVTRSPLDSCFAMYRTLFGAAYPFTYDFGDLARYYAAYRQLMQHWQRLFGDWLVRVRYADLVREPARVGAAMAAACELPWSDEALAIESNPAVSTTASAAQIRRPIYRSSVDRWRHYRAQLGPLIDALRAAGVQDPEADS